ncbi:2-oxo-4-hydroxy-4-carboxy-5-ureidoimidazoline decarboxylase [Microbacter sp. GSS18]|nr:2-oxo-4-hydroxy-4-carboxy-5-ureidoimidazoline decarboxylase [Microbacter sp. GSS18]
MINPDRMASAPGRFHVSEANHWPEARALAQFPERLSILDSTIRKTYFTAGNATSQLGFARIAEALVELGVSETCLNVTWAGDDVPTPQDWELMTTVLDAKLPLRVNVWSDALLGNGRDPQPIHHLDALRTLVDAGATQIAPGIVPAPDPDAEKRQMQQLDEHLALAAELGVTTTITLAQVGLRNFDDLVRVAKHAVSAGAARLDLMDSTSSMSPEAMRIFVRRFRAHVGDVDVTMHVHDEFGLATAAALAAASEGASPDVSMNGMSYRAGFAPLEEVVLALEVLYGVDTGIALEKIAHVSRVVAAESGLPIPQLKPLTGSFAHLKHMPGDAASAIQSGDSAFPPISHGIVPSRMGAHVEWVWGASSSLAQTRALASDAGMDLTLAETRAARAALDAAVAGIPRYPRWLRPEDARAVLVRTVTGMRGGAEARAAQDVVSDAVAAPDIAAAIVDALGQSAFDAVQVDSVRPTVEAVIGALTVGRFIDLLEDFRRFGEHAGGARPALSDAEESAINHSDDQERRRLAETAREYEARFGFRAVALADGRTAQEVTRELVAALSRNAAEELARSRAAVTDILSARITRAAGAHSTSMAGGA